MQIPNLFCPWRVFCWCAHVLLLQDSQEGGLALRVLDVGFGSVGQQHLHPSGEAKVGEHGQCSVTALGLEVHVAGILKANKTCEHTTTDHRRYVSGILFKVLTMQ